MLDFLSNIQRKERLLTVCILFTADDQHYVKKAVDSVPAWANVALFHHVIASKGSVKVIQETERISYYQVATSELHFANIRNLAKAKAQGKYVLMLDADERLLSHQHEDLYELLNGLETGVGGVFVNVVSWSVGMYEDGSASVVTKQCRLFRNVQEVQYEGRVHELCTSSIERNNMAFAESGIFIHHEGYTIDKDAMKAKALRNLRLLEAQIVNNEADERATRYYESTKHLITHL